MPKIAVRSFAESPETPAPDHFTLRDGRWHEVLSGPSHPLEAHLVRLSKDGTLGWSGSRQGHVAYVLSGTVTVSGVDVGKGGAIIAEHKASVQLAASAEGAELVIFNRAEDHAERPAGSGGHLHILPPEGVPYGSVTDDQPPEVYGSLYSDSTCPTCDLWLHGNRFVPHRGTPLHTHNEDEIIVVTGGSMLLGRKECGPGTVLAVARDTLYGFDPGKDGLEFINFRPGPSTFTVGDGSRPPVDEGEVFRNRLGQPHYAEPTLAA